MFPSKADKSGFFYTGTDNFRKQSLTSHANSKQHLVCVTAKQVVDNPLNVVMVRSVLGCRYFRHIQHSLHRNNVSRRVLKCPHCGTNKGHHQKHFRWRDLERNLSRTCQKTLACQGIKWGSEAKGFECVRPWLRDVCEFEWVREC